jgi:hypothetical protein
MTAKKDLKKRVRDRQAHTGESYTAALAQVLARRPAGEPLLIELADLTAEAAALGLHVRRVYASPPVLEQIDGPSALAQLRDALRTTDGDADTELLRSVLLAGARPTLPRRPGTRSLIELRRFVSRVQAGIGGPNQHGTMLALNVQGHRERLMIICALRFAPDPIPEFLATRAEEIRTRYPALFVATPDRLLGSEGLVAWL